jgi:lipopolysaccharide transport system ATP-binding protein
MAETRSELSMSDTVIQVENLGKRYRIAHQQQRGRRYVALRDVIAHKLAAPLRAMKGKDAKSQNGSQNSGLWPAGSGKEDFWALRKASFQVKQGDVVGIIGRNGAGKSTLLKLLSRITEPSEGNMRLRGRVASLLEVGTVFHPELTGRENIFLNGAILGMHRAEIRRKFDEIVAFAEVERFLDTPVKHFSSGMYVRLAFAVAAHLEPEILIVDEVLAVGDAEFQKKCLGKVEDVSLHGRTVLFVSHSMPTILRLCKRVILLQRGLLAADGPAQEITRAYLSSGTESPVERIWEAVEKAPGDHVARLRAVRVKNASGKLAETIDISQPFEVEVEYWNLQDRLKPTVSIHFTNDEGVLLFVSSDFVNQDWWSTTRKPGLIRARCQVPANLLSEGQLFILAAVVTYNPDTIHALERDAVSFQAVDQYDLERTREKFAPKWPGAMRPKLEWNIQQAEA